MEIQTSSIDMKTLSKLKIYSGKTFVIKYGGSIMTDEVAKDAFVNDVLVLTSLGIKIVIVHGGGPEISKWLNKIGIESKFIKGLRVTDKTTMEIVEMVLSGHVNKDLASSLSRAGINAIGISGKDSNLIKAKKKYLFQNREKVDLGFVGEVISINKKVLLSLIEKGYVPTISPVGFDAAGNSYNINADYAAAFISASLKAEKLIIMTDIKGVYTDISNPSTFLSSITTDEIKQYIENGIIAGGMIPKLECCVNALKNGTKDVHLTDGREKHSLIYGLTNSSGTKIIKRRGVNQWQKII